MRLLTENLDAVSGGSAYDVGHTVGAFAAGCLNVFCEMGKLYVPLL